MSHWHFLKLRRHPLRLLLRRKRLEPDLRVFRLFQVGSVPVVGDLRRALHAARLERLAQPGPRDDDRVGRQRRDALRHLDRFRDDRLVRLRHFVDDVEPHRLGRRQLSPRHGDLGPDL